MTRPALRRALDAGGIDLWLARCEELREPAAQEAMRALLDAAERVREQRFRFAEDRLRHLIARAMVRQVLSEYADVAPADWRFVANAHGRPEIAPGHGPLPDRLRFNLSHTNGLVALAVSQDRAVGVDVEHLAGPTTQGIAEQFFSAREAADLTVAPPERQAHRFYEYWTLKESYIKARGLGLALPLDRFSFVFPQPGEIRLEFAPGFDDTPGRWHFWLLEPTAGHVLAVCAERLGRQAPALTTHRFGAAGGASA